MRRNKLLEHGVSGGLLEMGGGLSPRKGRPRGALVPGLGRGTARAEALRWGQSSKGPLRARRKGWVGWVSVGWAHLGAAGACGPRASPRGGRQA